MARGRGKASPQDKEALRIISEKIRELLKVQNKKQVDLSRTTGIPASTLTGYVKGTSLPVSENLEKIASFFEIPISDLDPRYGQPDTLEDSKIEFIYKQLDEDFQDSLLEEANRLLVLQAERKRIEKKYTPYTVFDSYAAKLAYDLALWIHTDSLEPKYPKGSVALIKQTFYDTAGAIYAIEYDGQTLIKRVFREAQGIRLVSLNKKYSDKVIPLEEEPRVIGKVIASFLPAKEEEL